MNAADVPTELFHAFEVQRTSFDAAPFPDWDDAARSPCAAAPPRRGQRGRDRGCDPRRLRRPAAHRDADRRGVPEPGRDQGGAPEGPQVDAAPQRGRFDLVPPGARAHPAATAGRRRDRGPVELSAVPGRRTAGRGAGRRQPRAGEDVGVHAGVLRAVRAAGREDLRAGGGRRGQRRPGCRGPVHAAAVQSPVLHRLHAGRPQGHGRRRGEPDADDARTRRQVADGHRAGLPAGEGRAARPRGQAAERGTDLHRARLRLRSPRRAGRLRRGDEAPGEAHVSGGPRRPRLLQHHQSAPVRSPGRLRRGGAHRRRRGRSAVRRPHAGRRAAPPRAGGRRRSRRGTSP